MTETPVAPPATPTEWRVSEENRKALREKLEYLYKKRDTFSDRDIQPWRAQEGSQQAFLTCTTYELLYSGERGPGKTDSLLMAFARHVGQGWGRDWRGVIFRRTYPELADIIEKSQRWFPTMFPGAKYNAQKSQWRFATGESLLFRNFQRRADYWSYHGHAYPFIGWEELTNWPDDTCYTSMFSCSRSTRRGIPIMMRATTNPYGVGHQWVKMRFRLDGWPRRDQIATPEIADAVDESGFIEPPRRTIFGRLKENRILLNADPNYPSRIRAAASNPAMADAWMNGSWDIIAGGMFEHCWDRNTHIVRPFVVPHTWRVDRGYDYGSTHPAAVIWFAESDGCDYQDREKKWHSTVRGDLFCYREWYLWTGKPNVGKPLTMAQTALGIIEREIAWGWDGRVKPGPADSNIFTEADGTSLAASMAKSVRLKDGKQHKGITWTRADKRAGSRVMGWAACVERLEQAKRPKQGVREKPGLFVVGDYCPQIVRTFPSLPRDEKNMDDADTKAEDHLPDVIRYRIIATGNVFRSGKHRGMM